MAYKRKTLRQKRKSTRRRKSSHSRKLHGGCKDGNCLYQTQNQPLPHSLPHSNFSQNGGQFPPSFSNVPIRSFYPLNTYENDPSRQLSHQLSRQPSSSNTVTGGRGKKSRRRNSRSRSQKGGFLSTPGLSTLFAYGQSTQPSNITSLAFHDESNRPYA